MNKNTRNIVREKIIRINLYKKEIFKKITKSINQNNNIKNSIKIYTNFILNKNLKKSFFLSRKHKICIYTGKRGGLLKGFNLSRYVIKTFILRNRLTNIKKNNW